MSHNWKPGDRAMVTIDESADRDGYVRLRIDGGLYYCPASALAPLPAPAEPLTAPERDAFEKLLAWRTTPSGDACYRVYINMIAVLDKVVAARKAGATAPAPLTELERTAVEKLVAWCHTRTNPGDLRNAYEVMINAGEALIAARKPKAPEDVFAQAFAGRLSAHGVDACRFWETGCFTTVPECTCRAAVTAALAAVESVKS